MGAVSRHDMPSGDTVFYRDSDHAYWKGHDEKAGKCSGRIPGISTISKNDGDTSNDGLLDWAARLACQGMAQAVAAAPPPAEMLLPVPTLADLLPWLASAESIQAKLKESQSTWRDIRDAAGTRGSFSHDVLQNLSEAVSPMLRSGYDMAVVDWWKKTRPDVELVEQVVYSAVGGYAGRFDLMALIGGKRVLMDLKTSKYASNAFAVQLNLYRLAAIESGLERPDKLMILQVREDGNWHELDVPINPEWAIDALRVYEHGREIRKALSLAKKASEKPRQEIEWAA